MSWTAKWFVIGAIVLSGSFLGACEEEAAVKAPDPAPLTRAAVGYYCNMTVVDHDGPKGQIHIKNVKEPVWFSSVRDTVAFTMLPDEPKQLTAVYVHDAGRMDDWTRPGKNIWIEARTAIYVLDSKMLGGMRQLEAVPFSERAAAQAFIQKHGGHISTWADIPRKYILINDEDISPGGKNAPHKSKHGDKHNG